MKLLTGIFFFITVTGIGQPLPFEIHFGDAHKTNVAKSVKQLSSGSIYFLSTVTDSLGATQPELRKFSDDGVQQFVMPINSTFQNVVVETMGSNQSGFLLCGRAYISPVDYRPLLMQIDTNGIFLWENIYGNLNGALNSVATAPSGNIYGAGFVSDSTGDLNFYLLKTDISGNLLDQFDYGSPLQPEVINSCILSSSNQLILVGDKTVSQGRVNGYVLSVDTLGIFLWDVQITNMHNSGTKNGCIDANGDLVITGETETNTSSLFDIQLSKIDKGTGTLSWNKILTGTDQGDAGFNIIQNGSMQYVITGYGFDSVLQQTRAVIVFTDSSGNELQRYYFGNSSVNIGVEIVESYGGYLAAATDYSNNQCVLLRTANLYNEVPSINSNEPIFAWPNPVTRGTLLFFSHSFDNYSLWDAAGRVYSSPAIGNNSVSIAAPPGKYLLRIESDGRPFYQWLIVQ